MGSFSHCIKRADISRTYNEILVILDRDRIKQKRIIRPLNKTKTLNLQPMQGFFLKSSNF